MNPALTPQQWRAVEQLFHAACDASPSTREDLILQGSRGDALVAEVVMRLLVADAEPALLDGGIDGMVAALFAR